MLKPAALPDKRREERPGLAGVVPPVCTPLTPDLDVDVRSLERLVDSLLEGGVNGLFALGSTGEVAYLPDRHRRRALETVIARAAGSVPVLAGVIDTSTLRVLEHAREAEQVGADGIVVTAPFYARTHPKEIEGHFRFLAERIGIPIYAYDLPVSVHTKLDPDLLSALAADGVIAGVKDSSGDTDAMRRLLVSRRRHDTPETFRVLTGSELIVDAALQMGADGVVPGLGNVDPAGYARLYRLSRDHNWDAARKEQDRLVRLFSIVDVAAGRMGRNGSALGAFKAALWLLGVIDSPVTAPPQLPLNEGEVERIRSIVDACGLL